jgi:hypothetical protein
MSKTSGPVFQLINNFRFDSYYPRENIEFVINYKPENTDKFLVTYPKCGTTWTQQIICLVHNNGIPNDCDKEFVWNSFIDFKGEECIKTSLNPRVFKIHMPFNSIPYNKKAQYLCVLRNPKDVCVSYYYHTRHWPHHEFNGDFHEYFKYWIKGDVPNDDYFQHVLSFWSHRFDDNFTFLVYEHMKNNPKEVVLKIAEFLIEEFVLKLKENYDFVLNKVIENSTIHSMKSNLDSVFGYSLDFLMRKGLVGDWRNYFNKEESYLVDEKVRKLFSGTGLEKLWVEEMKW